MIDNRIGNIFSTVILFFYIITTPTISQSYLWPTDASRLLTSTFAEYRPNRFHAGIDVKTWGRVGYPVFAIRSGYISQIEVSPFGYGRLLYLKLDTGETALYAHLHQFAPTIEAYVKQQQQFQGRFSINLTLQPDQFPVKQGDIVAFTGQSGTGLPHLHFEILDENGRPTNPLLKSFDLVDTISPAITSVAILPLSASSRVDGDLRPRLLQPRPIEANRYIIDTPIRVRGMIGFAIKVHDKMDETWNGFGVYRLSLQLNERMVFSAQYDFFDYAQNRQANLDRDYRLMKRGHGIYNRLFRDIGNELPFYQGDQPYYGVVAFAEEPATMGIFAGLWRFLGLEYARPSGVIDLPAGKYELRITVQDFFGNTSVLTGTILASAAGDEKHSSVVVAPSAAKEIKPQINVDFYDDFMRVEVITANGSSKPALVVHYQNGSSEQLNIDPVAPRKYVAGIAINQWREKPVLIQALQETAAGKIKLMEKEINFEMVLPNRRQSVTSPDGNCQIDFDHTSLFKPLFMRLRVLPGEAVANGRLISSLYELQPADVPLRRNMRISIRTDVNQAQNIGLFRKKNHGDWEFIGDSLSIETGCITALASELGVYALIGDEAPPIITALTPAMGARLQNRRPRLLAKIIDELSGIGGEENWQLFLDEQKVIAEYDPEAHTLFYQPEAPLDKGEHQVRLWVRDRCGNTAVKTNTFYIY